LFVNFVADEMTLLIEMVGCRPLRRRTSFSVMCGTPSGYQTPSSPPTSHNLLTAGFLTGARELVALNVGDFDPAATTLTIARKTGRRTIILQSDAVTFFSRIAADRGIKETLLKRSDGARWNRSHQQRRMAATLAASGPNKSGTFCALRHSYISRAIEGGVPLNIIAENCGMSVRMIENTCAKILAEKRRDFIERGAPSLS
jgi:integrase